MELDGLHLLLTWSCTFECDHCFVFGSPRQSGTMTLARIRDILDQASSIEWIYFEGGSSTASSSRPCGKRRSAAIRWGS